MKKGQVGTQNLIAWTIILFVIAVVTFGVIKFGIPGLIDLIFPSGQPDPDNPDEFDVQNQIYLDSGDELCKPFEGLYRLNNGKLEVWEESKWYDVDSQVAGGKGYLYRRLRDAIVEFVNVDFKIDFEGEHSVSLWENGISTDIGDGNTYVYIPDNPDDYLGIRNVDPDTGTITTGPKYPDVLNLFEEAEEKRYENLMNAFIYALESAEVSFDEQMLEVGLSKKNQNIARIYVDYEGVLFAIDSNNNFYIPQGDFWKEINKEVATDVQLEAKQKKDELLEACK